MARTKQEVFDDMIARKDADGVLSVLLTSISKVAFFRAVFWLIADVVSDFERVYDSHVTTITALLESRQVHTGVWWRRTALAFQLGDPLVILDNGNLTYDPINADNQIVQRAAVLSNTPALAIVKVAKLDDGSPVPLDPSELAAFTAYMNDVRPFTTAVVIVNEVGDEVKIGVTARVDPQLINSADGTLLSDGTTKPVEAAIFEYMATFENDDFGGTFYGNRLLETILGATGVVNAYLTILEKKSTGDASFIDILATPSRAFETFSGYVRIADAFDLTANITYNV